MVYFRVEFRNHTKLPLLERHREKRVRILPGTVMPIRIRVEIESSPQV